MLKISLSNLDSLFEKIAETKKLYMPIGKNDGTSCFDEWQRGAKLSTALNTVKSPKDFFFPQTEDLMRFKTEGKNIEVVDIREENEEFVVFGVRACDTKSFDILDRVFLTEPRDSFYAMKREKGIIISVACQRPSETCFCSAFGIDASEPQGDVSAWLTDREIFFKANTKKGEALLDKISHVTEEAYENEVEDRTSVV